LLVRYTHEAINLAHFLISKGYNVQSSEGLQIGSHPAIQLLINLLKQDNTQLNTIDQAYIHQTYGQLTPEQTNSILQAQQLPLYEQVQTLINILQLTQQEGVAPYLTAFQDLIYQFTKSRVADRKAFLEYWERKGKNKTIAASQTADTIRIMTIHSSKGLEFDIVFIPFFTWELTKERASDIIWCVPQTPPFNQLPLVAVHPSKKLLQSHFTNEYIQDKLAQTIDNLNLTYVAITRPKYRLYIYGQLNSRSSHSVGAEVFALYKDLLNDQLTYCKPAEGTPAPLPPLKPETTTTYPATYIAEPIRSRLTLRSRAEDDFAPDTPLATVDLGILMHLWLSYIRTWDDAEPTLAKLIRQGQVTDNQAQEMRQQLQKLQALIARENHHDWFSNQYTILSEQDIITPSGNMQRPDRVMISGKHAIVIDYKFGHEQPTSHLEQVRDYMSLLRQMGYTTEGYIIYNALQTIHSIQ
jgi:ATP-dependent exoDNAse (exonuclease V) beta subunit